MEAGLWTDLGALLTSPGVLTEVIHLFLARDLRPVQARPETHEVIEPRWLPLTEAIDLAVSGHLADGKSIVGLVWANHALRTRGAGATADAGIGGIA